GPFTYGLTKVEIPAFYMARYPVTNAHYQSFIDDGGYEHDAWWTWLNRRRQPHRPGWSHPTHPRENVSWFEAMAFCRWLEARLRSDGAISQEDSVHLPSEQQWEKAARGADGREYPWGDHYESGRANIYETFDKPGPYYLRQTSAVGI